MRKYIILFITILCVIENSYGVKNMEISTPVTTSQTHAARDYIRLKPGFSFNSTGNKAFRAYIDEHLLEPASLLTGPAYPNRSLNTSYAVGTIAGEASVSPTGAAIYQIPIEVMPGTGGIQPNVSVVYNSQSGNGVVGYAWNLGGISAITRTGKTLYHDGSISGLQLTNSDNLMLDGQRLMRASGSNLLASSTYRTEIETYLDITCKTLNSYLGFEVKNKEGWTMEYGSSADSYIKPKGGSTAYAWLLKKVTDANGNYMTYTYDNDASTGEFRLKQIDYTGNSAAGMAPYNKIEFFYETRPDISTSYIAGKSIRQSVVLKRIKCSAYGSAVREYKFNYHYDAYDLFYFKLGEIEEYGQNGLRYNSTIIHWGDYGSVPQVTGKHYSSYLSETRPSTSYPLFADFDGDGRTDLFSYDFAFTDAKLYLSAINSIGDVSFQKKCTTPLGGTSFRGFLTGDFNGDGKMDLARISSVSGKYKYEFFLFNGSQFVNSSKSFTTTGQTGIVGDFNGDGKMEILVKETKQVFDANGTAPIATGGIDSWGTSYLYCFANNRYLCDFNGNGKTDILVMNGTSCWVYELSGDTFVKLTAFNSTDLKNTQFPYLGDFNGDGKTDILVQNNNLTISTILFSTGAGFEKKTIPSISTGGAKVYVGNYNQDAQSDILFLSAESTRIRLTTGFFNGAEFMLNSVLSSVMTTADLAGIPALPYEQQAMYYVTGDFNGDGRSEFCLARHSDRNLMHTFTDRQNLSVRMIKNGLNNSVSFEYNPLSNTSCYTPATASPAFPVCKIQPALFVVKSMISQAGSLTDTQSYSYKNARAHRQGKGFLGFEEITASSSQQGKSVTTQYGYNTTSFNTYPVKQTVKTTLGGLISETTFSNSNYTTGVSKVIFPYVSSQTAIDRLTGITRTTAYTYSAANHGNPDRITGTQGSLVTETTYTWEAKNSPYKNRMTQQVTVRRGLTPTFSETKKFEYDSKARLTKQIDYYGHSQAVTTAYSNFDNFGNARTVTAAAADCPPVTTSSVFDATGRFVISNTDALGNVSSAKYDAVTGVLLEKTDIAGLKTEHQYDGFQQLVQTDTPFDKVTCSTSWDISGNNLFKTETQSLISGTQTIWYNAAKQEIKTQIPGFSGTVVSGKEYNAKGQLYRSYLPGYGSKSSQFVEYEYDTYGRITKEINIGRTTSHSYNGLTTTVTMPNGTARSSTLNTSGLTASTKDEAGNTVTYTYNSLGKPVAITSAGAVTSITYDDRGFQKTLKDANMANPVQYAYNAYGQLASQTNARGQATTMTYDAGGRITQKVSPERTLNYEYVPSGNGIGQIKTIKELTNIPP